MRNGFLLLLQDTILIDCCDLRKRELEKEYDVIVVKKIEQAAIPIPHCGLRCLKGRK